MSTVSTGRGERGASRARWLALVLVGVLVLGAGATLIVGRIGQRSSDPEATAEPRRGIEAAHVLLVAEGEADSLPAMALLAATQRGGAVVLIPATLVVEVPGAGPLSLARALAETGPEGLAVSVANAVPMKVPTVAIGSAAAVAATVDTLGVTVDIPDNVVVEEAGQRRTVYTAGPRRMQGAEFVAYQTASLPGQLELDRLVRQGAGWRALLGSLRGAGAEAMGSWSGDVGRAAEVIEAAGGEPTVTSMPTERLVLAGEDLYQVDRDGIDPLRRTLEEFVTVEDRPGRRVQLLVATDAPVGPAVGRRLVDAGYIIVLTGPAGRTSDTTQIIVTANVSDGRRAGGGVAEVLGLGRVEFTDRRFTVLDIMLVVGSDWAEANGFTTR